MITMPRAKADIKEVFRRVALGVVYNVSGQDSPPCYPNLPEW